MQVSDSTSASVSDCARRAAARLSPISNKVRSSLHANCGQSTERQLNLPFRAGDRLDPHLDRVAEPVAAARAAAGERRPGGIELEELPGELPRRQKAFVDAAETGEEAGADQAGDLALPGLLPAAGEQRVF